MGPRLQGGDEYAGGCGPFLHRAPTPFHFACWACSWVLQLPARISCFADKLCAPRWHPSLPCRNDFGQLCTGNTTSLSSPALVLSNVTDVAMTGQRADGFITCAILKSGHTMCCGSGVQGQLGDGRSGTTVNTTAWVQLSGGPHWFTGGW
jgi:hypothetical protein